MILYNGATGGLGRHLAAALARRGTAGTALRSRLEDPAALARELAGLSPASDAVTLLHLAARVSVPACEADPDGTFTVNVTHAVAAVETFRSWAVSTGRSPSVVYVSSGHVYAAAAHGVRLDEDAPVAPRSVYARTKLRAEEELRALAERRALPLVIARVFGLIAPGQPAHYVLPALIRRVREDRLAGIPGLSYSRDYLDARDVCDDLLSLSEVVPGVAGEIVNVCSGEGVTIRDLLREVVQALRPGAEGDLLAAATEAPGRADDVPWIVGDPSRFVARTARRPRTLSLRDTVRDAVAQG